MHSSFVELVERQRIEQRLPRRVTGPATLHLLATHLAMERPQRAEANLRSLHENR
jgi:hypothetical protein